MKLFRVQGRGFPDRIYPDLYATARFLRVERITVFSICMSPIGLFWLRAMTVQAVFLSRGQ